MSQKVIVIHPELSSHKGADGNVRIHARIPEASLEEAVGLARAINLEVVHQEIVKLPRLTPATIIGKGTVARIRDTAKELQAKLIFVDYALSPVQQRNLEKAWDAKVIDRTGLILEIFGARARTKEGQLQVELAALSFQRSRLVRSWTHLERQRGGFGFMGGPGETQIETDRRLIDERVRRLKADLESVRANRKLQRESRKREPYPIVAIVGYTNAGKSTLFNRLTGSEVFVKDLLFATLDTTMRGLELPSGKQAILSDTVGFISELPTQLVAAFRATLEEVAEATVILHVRDIGQENTEAEREDVLSILRSLDIDAEHDPRVIEVLNKIDSLPEEDHLELVRRTQRHDSRIVAVSAMSGEGIDTLLGMIDDKLGENREVLTAHVDIADGKAIAWLYRRGQVVGRKDTQKYAQVTVSLEPEDIERFNAQFGYKLTEPKISEKKSDKKKPRPRKRRNAFS